MFRKIGVILIAVLFLGSMAVMPVVDQLYAADSKSAVKGCDCGKDCKCEHCKSGKGECSCKSKGNGKGCNCAADAKGGCQCGKDCMCEHCKTGKGTCSCKGGGKGGCQCGKSCNCGHCAGGADSSAQKPTSDADYAKSMKSKAGTFNASYTSDPEAIAPNKLIIWKLKVETADGKAVKDAEITLSGDMPEHGHGLPTQPKVTKNYGDGTYMVEGIKFSMTGWWTMTFTIKAGGKTDTVTFNLQLK
ncbi:MAG: FixH family protein [Nitrospirae bacterium]|nr:FixH family protein [Nitrospirota bacterium]